LNKKKKIKHRAKEHTPEPPKKRNMSKKSKHVKKEKHAEKARMDTFMNTETAANPVDLGLS
jgi:hypothetical protein